MSTNNLDIATLTILEDYLDRYDGIVVTVSHDRYFLDRTMKRIFAFEGDGKLKQYEGGYTDYVNRLAAEGRTPVETLRRGLLVPIYRVIHKTRNPKKCDRKK